MVPLTNDESARKRLQTSLQPEQFRRQLKTTLMAQPS